MFLAERARPRAQQVPTALTRWIFPTVLLLWTPLRPRTARSAKQAQKRGNRIMERERGIAAHDLLQTFVA